MYSLTLSRQASAKIVFSVAVKAREYRAEYEPPLFGYFALLREYIIPFRRTHAPRKRKRESQKKGARGYFANGSIFIRGLKP